MEQKLKNITQNNKSFVDDDDFDVEVYYNCIDKLDAYLRSPQVKKDLIEAAKKGYNKLIFAKTSYPLYNFVINNESVMAELKVSEKYKAFMHISWRIYPGLPSMYLDKGLLYFDWSSNWFFRSIFGSPKNGYKKLLDLGIKSE